MNAINSNEVEMLVDGLVLAVGKGLGSSMQEFADEQGLELEFSVEERLAINSFGTMVGRFLTNNRALIIGFAKLVEATSDQIAAQAAEHVAAADAQSMESLFESILSRFNGINADES